MKIKSLTCTLAAAVAGTVASHAAFLSIDDSSPNETIVVDANDFEAGLQINGVSFQQGLGNPATGTFNEADINGTLSFVGSWIAPAVQGSGSRTIYLTEPSDGSVSDVLHVEWVLTGSIATITGTFHSDVEGAPKVFPPPGAEVQVEDGSFVDFSLPFLTAQFRSDNEVPGVPDSGSTLSLLGLAFAFVGAASRKLRR